MITEAIILAGGLGTRLREAVPGIPKAMAPVADKAFLGYVIDSLRMQGVRRIIFSLGYQAGMIRDFLQQQYPTLDHITVTEDEPLGTGGAICLALGHARTPHVLVANGDTLFRIQLKAMEELHMASQSLCTLALKPMKDIERYGVVETDDRHRIISFREKQHGPEALINGGVYILDREAFLKKDLPAKFSFEKDFLEKYYTREIFSGSVQNGYFIDIGIPADFEKAQQELRRPPPDLRNISKEWTLFLDRDGVINDEKVGYYVRHWGEFIFSSGVLQVFRRLGEYFGRIIIVSNQRGVGRGLMTIEALDTIHLEMTREVEIAGGRIDRIYYCTDTDDLSFFRKPNPGMAYQAMLDFPDIDPRKSVMVGNKPGDMRFGRWAGMFTVFVKTTNPGHPLPDPDIDLVFDSLSGFAEAIER